MGKKKLKELVRAKQSAFIESRLGGSGTASNGESRSDDRPSVDRFLQSYGELTDATVELYRRLDQEDPLLARVRAVLVQAQAALAPVLGEQADHAVGESSVVGADSADAAAEQLVTSMELVPSPSRLPVVAPPRVRSRYPDEATLARYLRNRRETGPHYPDQAILVRYIHVRRQTGPHYPDEAAISRYLRRRRELYALTI